MTMTPGELEAQKDTLELLNNEVASRLTRQSESLAKIDTKAVFLIGFAATAVQFLATHRHHDILACCAFAAYAISLLAGVQTFRVSEYKDLEPRHLVVSYARLPKGLALIRLASSRASLFEENQRRHQKKARCWLVSLGSLIVGLGLSTVALLLHT